MADKKEWQEYALTLKKVLGLELSPVSLSCIKETPPDKSNDKVRICRAFVDAAQGKSVCIGKDNNACFGASWHMGFRKIDDPKVAQMVKKFVVEGEKLFCSYEALDKLISRMEPVPDNSCSYFSLAPMETAEFAPELVIFVCNAAEACRLLTLVVFIDGEMPNIKIGGPTCRMSVMEPLLTGQVNLSFYDYTARKISKVAKDKLLVSIPYAKIPQIVGSLDKCSAGSAKIEYPEEFRRLLQRSMGLQSKGESAKSDSSPKG
jgi:uncharacterized protein (DUF169 family)